MSTRVRKPTVRKNIQRPPPPQNNNTINLIPRDVAFAFFMEMITPVSDRPFLFPSPPRVIDPSVQESIDVSAISNNQTDERMRTQLIQQICYVPAVVHEDSTFILMKAKVRPHIDILEASKYHLKDNPIGFSTTTADGRPQNIIADDDDDIIVID